MLVSPLVRRRLRAFMRIRRAWLSLWALAAIFAFCLCADWVCPCDPRAVVDPATLAKHVSPVFETAYDVRTARWSEGADGEVFDFEGPEDVRSRLCGRSGGEAADFESEYAVTRTPRDGYVRVFMEPKTPPAERRVPLALSDVSFPFRPVSGHPFGIDAGGRDVYSRVVHGMRIALLFGLALALSGLVFGVVFGAVEGYFGGVADIGLQRFTEIWSAIPFLYVTIFVGSTLGRSFGVLLACYAAFNWIAVSYYVRAEFLRLRGRPFVDAAKVGGVSAWRIMFVHLLPNALTPLVTLFPFLLMGAIGTLSALDFLGFGLPPMTPSCGELLQEAQQFRFAWWLVVFPASALFVVMLLAVLVGEGLRDAFDPRQNSRLE